MSYEGLVEKAIRDAKTFGSQYGACYALLAIADRLNELVKQGERPKSTEVNI